MQMDLSTVLLPIESITIVLESNGLCRVKIKSSLKDVMLLSDSNDEGTQVFDLAMYVTSPF